jgi:hypothetical protein
LLSVIVPLAGNATRAAPLRRPLERLLVVVRVLASVEVSKSRLKAFCFNRSFYSLEETYADAEIGRGGRYPRDRDDRHPHKSGATT